MTKTYQINQKMGDLEESIAIREMERELVAQGFHQIGKGWGELLYGRGGNERKVLSITEKRIVGEYNFNEANRS